MFSKKTLVLLAVVAAVMCVVVDARRGKKNGKSHHHGHQKLRAFKRQVGCLQNEFRCMDGSCIQNAWLCDGDADCIDFSDENDCTSGTCLPNQFQCFDHSKCIDDRWKCDGEGDCLDNSDEINCMCDPTSEWKCYNGRCIDVTWRCDNNKDCGDSSDEMNCPTIHPSQCSDMLTLRDCALMNETSYPICLDSIVGHKFCRKFCGICKDRY